tara:strand:+ start:8327 stop:9313 length:987 start_codon:yes stop_codon:yes gene_type:complete
MINIFYEPDYAKRKKEIFTFKITNSVLLNKLIDVAYLFNFHIPEAFITNGPHKLMNHVVKNLSKNSKASFNKIKYDNNFILQFDNFGEDKLKEIINQKNSNTKVLIGPLYTVEHLKQLFQYVSKYDFIKVVSCSIYAKDALINDLNLGFSEENIVVMPIGIKPMNSLLKERKELRNNRCLIYFKNRSLDDLNLILEFLKSKGIKYDIIEYGSYSNNQLKKLSKRNHYGILLASTESQGFAIQEIMSNNLPMIVWDKNFGEFEGRKIRGTSVTVWDNNCGLIVNTFDEFSRKFNSFIKNLDSYNPKNVVIKNLTYEVFLNNLNKQFLNF